MSELDMELAALRTRRPTPAIVAWLRSLRPFDRRAIREPDERDAYWDTVRMRLAESDAAFLRSQRSSEPPPAQARMIGLDR